MQDQQELREAADTQPDLQARPRPLSPGLGLNRKDKVHRPSHDVTQAPLWPVGHVPSLHIWLTTAVQEPNWPAGMSLPLLENLIKTRARAILLQVMSPRKKGGARGRNAQDSRGPEQGWGGTNTTPSPVPTATPNLAKTGFHETLGHPSLTALCYFIQNYPSFLGRHWGLYGKERKKNNNNHF